jgi:glutamate/tyrosine decarboxylase-like PLP-dependent enzyme
MNSTRRTLSRNSLLSVAGLAADFLESSCTRPVSSTVSPGELRRHLDRALPVDGTPADLVIRELARDVEPGLIASTGPRYFGYVVGGTTPAGLMADWLTSVWDQNAQTFTTSPAAAAAEAIVARWIVELFALPAQSSVGLVTGCQMANFTALTCARDSVLGREGWDLKRRGLFGAPPITVFMSDCGHATVKSALHMMGIGSEQICEVSSDSEGRMHLKALEEEIQRASGRPMVLSVQAGNVNSGAFEPIDAIADLVRSENAWIHVDGAFGLWAAVSPQHDTRLRGLELADSWATDAHKWLNVPYDSGLVILKDPTQHRGFKAARCAYAGEKTEDHRDGSDWVPENSRRARAFVLYAVLRELGRSGVRSLVERCCVLAQQFARGASSIPGAEVLNEVVLNQVLVRINHAANWDDEAFHQAVAARVQAEGKCWLGTTYWKGVPSLRLSICNWLTSEKDIALALDSLARAVREVNEQQPGYNG